MYTYGAHDCAVIEQWHWLWQPVHEVTSPAQHQAVPVWQHPVPALHCLPPCLLCSTHSPGSHSSTCPHCLTPQAVRTSGGTEDGPGAGSGPGSGQQPSSPSSRLRPRKMAAAGEGMAGSVQAALRSVQVSCLAHTVVRSLHLCHLGYAGLNATSRPALPQTHTPPTFSHRTALSATCSRW